MTLNFSKKIAICYACAGPTYRASALKKLECRVKADNIKYFVLTDDKQYFNNILDQDIIVKELNEFYAEFPETEEYEFFIKTDSIEEYGNSFLKRGYVFPYSVMRFLIKMAHDEGITNIALLGTDTDFNFSVVTDELLSDSDKLYCAVSWWPPYENEIRLIKIIQDVIKDLWNIEVPAPTMIYDEAARFYVFNSVAFTNTFFNMYHRLVVELFKRNFLRTYCMGSYAYNEEIIMAVLYSALNIQGMDPGLVPLFAVKHDSPTERPWTVGAGPWETKNNF